MITHKHSFNILWLSWELKLAYLICHGTKQRPQKERDGIALRQEKTKLQEEEKGEGAGTFIHAGKPCNRGCRGSGDTQPGGGRERRHNNPQTARQDIEVAASNQDGRALCINVCKNLNSVPASYTSAVGMDCIYMEICPYDAH